MIEPIADMIVEGIDVECPELGAMGYRLDQLGCRQEDYPVALVR